VTGKRKKGKKREKEKEGRNTRLIIAFGAMVAIAQTPTHAGQQRPEEKRYRDNIEK